MGADKAAVNEIVLVDAKHCISSKAVIGLVSILADIEHYHCRMNWDREVRPSHFQTIFAHNCSNVPFGS